MPVNPKQSVTQVKKPPYAMKYLCLNCKQEFVQWFEFGEIAQQGTCSRCGVDNFEMEKARLFRAKY